MTNPLPFVSCICCTYRHPRLLQNSLACFLAQDYPADRRELVILDDSGENHNQKGEGWEVVAVNRRFSSLSEKHNAVASLVDKRCEVMCVWDDDDVYLPWHISTHVQAMNGKGESSKPSVIYSTYGRVLHQEPGHGRFQGSIAFTRELFKKVDGWEVTGRADFDQDFIKRLNLAGYASNVYDPCKFASPSYVYRWETTETSHCSAYMKSGEDETWYDRYKEEATFQTGDYNLVPNFDSETINIYNQVDKTKGIVSVYEANTNRS